jgi:hypothetical protein
LARSKPRTTVRVRPASNSTSRAVTSPENSGSPAVLASDRTAIFTWEAILKPPFSSAMRSGSRNDRRNMSGRLRLSSTTA